MIDASIYLTTDGAPLPIECDTRPKASSLLLVPPFLKHFGGPMAGPAYLKGAGERAGHKVEVLDLNREWIKERITSAYTSGQIKGDHDKPSKELNRLYQEWQELCASHWPMPVPVSERESRMVTLYATHAEVIGCATNMAAGSFGEWVRLHLEQAPRPDLVGLSVMFSGQIFVVGYAEKTWVELLDAVASKTSWPNEVFKAGTASRRAKEDGATVPSFDLSSYGQGSLTLPVQASRGCAYGKCSFCTYPKIEGKHRKLSMAALEPVIEQASTRGAVLSFKDSLLVPNQLRDVGETIKGRVMWSACTKLHSSFDPETLVRLHGEGLRTLEIGLETLDEASQGIINKPQSPALLRSFLDAAAEAGVAIVINYMTGLPGADAGEEQHWLEVVHAEVATRPKLKAMIEHNTFQLEMISPMGLNPSAYGIEIERRWPWSSLLEYRISKPSVITA